MVLALVIVAVGGWSWARLSRPAPTVMITPHLVAQVRAAGTSPAMPWPTTGEAAVNVPSVGFAAQSGPEKPGPVASLTKVMTGYIVLHDHPLPALPTTPGAPQPPDANGPSITITPADVSIFETDVGEDQSNIQVNVGEVLSERQLVQGTLIRSANNLATVLGIWDAGSLPAFVAKMNATAAQLGMTSSHFVDASGFDPASVSTAADMLKVAAVAMQEPGFAQTVDHTSVTLPIVGTLDSYTPWIGVDGAVGVKSGYTSQAGGCDIVAIVRQVHGSSVLVLASSTGQNRAGAIAAAGFIALNLASVAGNDVEPVTAITAGQRVGTAADGYATVPVTVDRTVRVLAWPSEVVRLQLMPHGAAAGDRAGTPVGLVRITVGEQTQNDPAALAAHVPALTLSQRLF